MYVRLTAQGIQWPYDLMQLRYDEPGVSFPVELPDELLADFSVYRVQVASKPNVLPSQIAVLDPPVYENNQWIQNWRIEAVPEAQTQLNLERLAGDIRQQRQQLLEESDWTQAKDIPDSVSLLWQPYRQALRDIPAQANFPVGIEWPLRPGQAL